ncbi:hypothetical protein T4C_6043, partial [Trichinella pseudospiralis]
LFKRMQALPVERLKVRLLSCLDREKKVNNVAKACEAMDAIESVSMTKESLEPFAVAFAALLCFCFCLPASCSSSTPAWRSARARTPTAASFAVCACAHFARCCCCCCCRFGLFIRLAPPFPWQRAPSSRLGLLINEVRRSNQLHHPDLAKRCRLLIKKWRKLISTTTTTTTSIGATTQTITDNGVDTSATVTPGVAPVAADDRAIRIRIKLGTSVNEATILGNQQKKHHHDHHHHHRHHHQQQQQQQQQQVDSFGIEQAENRRKRKHSSNNAANNNTKLNGITKTHLSAISGCSADTFSLGSTVSKQCKPRLSASSCSRPSQPMPLHRPRPRPAPLPSAKTSPPPPPTPPQPPPLPPPSDPTPPPPPPPLPPSSPPPLPPSSPPPSPPPPPPPPPPPLPPPSSSPSSNTTTSTSSSSSSRLPKLKTTAELVADLTKCYPEELLVNISTNIGVDSTNAPQQATSNSGDDAPSPALSFSAVEQQPSTAGPEVNKLELLEKYLAEDADQQRQHHDHAVLAGSSSGACTTSSSSSVDSDTTSSRSSTPSRDKLVRSSDDGDLTPRPDPAPSPGDRVKLPSGAACGYPAMRLLPPIDRSMLHRLDEIVAPSKPRVSSLKYLDDYSNEPPEQTRTLAPFEQSLRMVPSELRQLHSRVLVKTTDGRRVLALPYLDIGLPDFLEYDNLPATTDQLLSWETVRW